LSSRRKATAMEYKEYEYHVEQTANPSGWKWTVFLEAAKTRTGRSSTRAHAVLDAQHTIDRMMKSSDNELS
jgi:hypothetical protein